jgi:hypothetical protein
MENRINILSELQYISPTVAEIVPVTPYQVPRGYFEDFASQMLRVIKEEQPSTILPNTNQNPYKVPEGYFETLPGMLLSRVKNEDQSSFLIEPSVNPYQVPQGYFEGLADSILLRIKATDVDSAKEELETLSPLLSKLDKTIRFSTPDGYFDELTGNVVAGTKAIDFVNQELENLSPLMSSLKTENVYNVPTGYFENLPEIILNRAKTQQPAKVVSMNFGRKIMRYAAAAIIAGIIITAGILLINKQDSPGGSNTIVQSEEKLQQETLEKLEGLSDDEINNFIENQTVGLPDFFNVATSAEIDSEDVKMMLADIPDAELKQYLEEYSDDAKEVLTN